MDCIRNSWERGLSPALYKDAVGDGDASSHCASVAALHNFDSQTVFAAKSQNWGGRVSVHLFGGFTSSEKAVSGTGADGLRTKYTLVVFHLAPR